ncbi:MAG: VCBS repeat-containing protein [Thermodesulfobacteriota bacterium]
MIRVRVVFLAALAIILSASAAVAQVKTFAVLPFAVNGPDKYAYLSQGIQDMLVSRLTWQGKFQPVDKSLIDQKAKAAPRSDADAKAVMSALKADYVVFGSMTVAGEDASLDVKVMDSKGQVIPKAAQTKLNTLIPAMEGVARDINAQVFKRPDAPRDPKTGQPVERVNQMNPAFVVNQTGENQQTYLNPNFRYAGNSDTPGSWRSQTLPFAANGIAVGDVDSDGRNEVVLITNSDVHVYRWQDRQLAPIAKYEGSTRLTNVRVSIVKFGAEKAAKIVVSAHFDRLPQASIFHLEGNKLVLEAERLPFYLASVKLPPRFQPQLVGSKGDRKELFAGGVYEMNYSGGKLSLGSKLALPAKANPFNFAYLPEEAGYKLVFADDGDHLNVVSGRNDVIAKTEDLYAGSGLGIQHDSLLAPTATPNDNYLWSYYYVPLPLVPVILGKTPELIVSKNISVASQFFENFRFFSQGEIHALAWDGVGLNLKWKTRRIKGTIVGYDVADIENDNTQDLVVCLNTYPGPTGLKNRRTLVLAYALDVDSTQQTGTFGNMEEVGN